METMVITTNSLENTLILAEKIGANCIGGEVFELISDLGGGKTAFTRGLVKGTGSTDEVSSPSFTINNTYSGGRLVVQHFDFYRLSESGVVGEELKEALEADKTVVVVEWGDIVRDVLGNKTIRVEIVPVAEESRQFSFKYPTEFEYQFEGIQQ